MNKTSRVLIVIVMMLSAIIVVSQEETPEPDPEATPEMEVTMEVTEETTPETEATDEMTPEATADLMPDAEVTVEVTAEVPPAVEVTPEMTPEMETTAEMTPEMEMTEEVSADIPVCGVDEVQEDAITSLDTITDDPEAFFGSELVVLDNIVDALAPTIFMMERERLFESDRLLVVYDTDNIEGFDVVQLADDDVEVCASGTVREFTAVEIHDEYTPDLDFGLFEETFGDYEGAAVLIASAVEITEEIDEDAIEAIGLRDVLDSPLAFIEQQVTIQEELVEYIAPNVFVLEDQDLFDTASLLVIYPQSGDVIDGFDVIELVEEDPEVTVTGTVREYIIADLETEFDVTLSDEELADYEGPVLIADSIILNDEIETGEIQQNVENTEEDFEDAASNDLLEESDTTPTQQVTAPVTETPTG